MYNFKVTRSSVALIFILFVGSILFAQTVTNVNALAAFASNMQRKYLKNTIQVEKYANEKKIPIKRVFPNGTVVQIHHIDNGKPIYITTANLGAAQTTRTDELWPGGGLGLDLTGSGYSKLGEWDSGRVRLTHQEFGSRVTQVDGATPTTRHSTHVAGTLVASGAYTIAKGMAYEANLKAYDWNNAEAEMALAAASGLEVSNHSYVFATGWTWHYNGSEWEMRWYGDITVSTVEDYFFGFYDIWPSSWDQVSYDAPNYLIVKAAGNDRNDTHVGEHYVMDGGTWVLSSDSRDPDGEYDSLPRASVAKNILTVGAVEELLNYTQPSDVIMSTFSSWGPTDDGRIKPDLVGNGVSILSADHQGNATYATISGTSMASPNVAGTLALLQTHYQNTHASIPMRSATLKGLALHTTDEAGSADGPDYIYGWGLMNAERAARLISIDSYGNDVIDEQILSNGGTYIRNVHSYGINPLRVTICWTDPQGTPVSSDLLNNRTPMLVNDLDLKLTENSTTYYPWKLDPDNPSNAATNSTENDVDNVEQVYISNPVEGTYTIEVSHDGTLSGGSQAFSIIVSGNSECADGSIIYNTETEKFNFCEDGMWMEK